MIYNLAFTVIRTVDSFEFLQCSGQTAVRHHVVRSGCSALSF